MCWKPCGRGRMWKRDGNKTPGLSTVVVVTPAPFTCGNHYILSAGLKENRPARELQICSRFRCVTQSLSGALTVFTKRFCYCRTPGSVGPPLTLAHFLCGRADTGHTCIHAHSRSARADRTRPDLRSVLSFIHSFIHTYS